MKKFNYSIFSKWKLKGNSNLRKLFTSTILYSLEKSNCTTLFFFHENRVVPYFFKSVKLSFFGLPVISSSQISRPHSLDCQITAYFSCRNYVNIPNFSRPPCRLSAILSSFMSSPLNSLVLSFDQILNDIIYDFFLIWDHFYTILHRFKY